MKKEINSLSNRLAELQVQRNAIIVELEEVEQQITAILDTKQNKNTHLARSKNATPSRNVKNKATAIDRTERFIIRGDNVKVLSFGKNKGEQIVQRTTKQHSLNGDYLIMS